MRLREITVTFTQGLMPSVEQSQHLNPAPSDLQWHPHNSLMFVLRIMVCQRFIRVKFYSVWCLSTYRSDFLLYLTFAVTIHFHTMYYNGSKTLCVFILCFLFCSQPEILLHYGNLTHYSGFRSNTCFSVKSSPVLPVTILFKFLFILLLHNSIYNINFAYIVLNYISTSRLHVLNTYLFIFVSQVHFCLCLFQHIF